MTNRELVGLLLLAAAHLLLAGIGLCTSDVPLAISGTTSCLALTEIVRREVMC